MSEGVLGSSGPVARLGTINCTIFKKLGCIIMKYVGVDFGHNYMWVTHLSQSSSSEAQVVHGDMDMDGEVDTEATSHGAAGKLTGPNVVPRQEQ
jgi:hypothetical protein